MVEVLILGAVVTAFSVCIREASQAARAETGLVVPRAVVLSYLVSIVTHQCVGVVEVTVDGAEVWGPPVHTHALVQTGLGIGSHCITQTLAVPACVAPTGIMHAGLIVGQVVYLAVASGKGLAVDNVAFALSPRAPEGIQAAGIHRVTCIPTQWAFLPRVHKLQLIGRHILAACFEVIFHVPIGVATQATEGVLGLTADLHRDTHVLVPHKCQVEPSRDVYVQHKIQGARLHL